MVNGKGRGISTKALILDQLRRQPGGLISGETLGEAAGVSRVAVWKAVKTLQNAGYPIRGDDRGYRLAEEDGGDFLYPWEFGEGEFRFYYWESTDSTMNRARELALGGAAGGTVITAETQTAGRGRNGRVWESPRGGLFFSLLERPRCAVADYARQMMLVQIALARALSAICGVPVRPRWPNDLYAGDQKIAGVLTELHGEGDRIEWLCAGVGVNVNNPVPLAGSVNCAAFRGRPLSRRETLLKILEVLAALRREDPGPRELCRRWNRDAGGIGRRVRILRPDHREADRRDPVRGEGIFLGIDESGRGLVQSAAALIRISPGTGALYFFPSPRGRGLF
jgi:BirA family biotin operon repressor/biotin-[acetyl-CoA-carboxylase] ligase